MYTRASLVLTVASGEHCISCLMTLLVALIDRVQGGTRNLAAGHCEPEKVRLFHCL